jgi:hypothetical protein
MAYLDQIQGGAEQRKHHHRYSNPVLVKPWKEGWITADINIGLAGIED